MEKLYYADSHIREFTATVTGCTASDRGWLITLDATAFYPEGGGQACDLGTLGNVNVLDVREKDEEILHLCDGPLQIGASVHGCIDWARRFDLMQQHTGEHIVSGLLHRYFGYHNTGFHVGAEVMEVDFDGPISAQQLQQIEREANEAVWQNIPVEAWIPAQEELPGIAYRTKRALDWPVRIVRVAGYDSCACCGVHVKRTGEVGLIKILTCVKFHGGIRLEMVCGGRAYRHMAHIFEQNRAVSQAFSAPMGDTAAAACKANDLLAQQKLRIHQLLTRHFVQVAQSCQGREQVIHFEQDLEPGQVRALADQLIRTVPGLCAVFSGSDGNYTYCLALRDGDLRQMNRELTAALDGRGGGKPNFQQGSLRCTREQILRFFSEKAQATPAESEFVTNS